jgi:tetratricopeptide (TPR) repeat protein
MDDYIIGKVADITRAKQKGDLPAAMSHVEELLRAKPAFLTAHGHKAHILHLQKETKKGLQWLSDHRPASGYPDYIEALEADMLWSLKRRDEARFLVDGLVLRVGLSDAAVKRIVELLDRMKDRSRARELVERWLPTASDRKAGTLLLATLQDNPATTLRQLLQDYPDDDDLWEKVTRVRLSKLAPEEALEELQVLVSTSRGAGNADFRRMLGTALRHAGRPQEALAEFQQCLQLQPHNAFYRAQLATSLADLGRTDAALDEFETAMAGRPHDVILRRNLYEHYRGANQIERATRFTEAMVARRPDLAGDFWGSLGSIRKAATASTPGSGGEGLEATPSAKVTE